MFQLFNCCGCRKHFDENRGCGCKKYRYNDCRNEYGIYFYDDNKDNDCGCNNGSKPNYGCGNNFKPDCGCNNNSKPDCGCNNGSKPDYGCGNNFKPDCDCFGTM